MALYIVKSDIDSDELDFKKALVMPTTVKNLSDIPVELEQVLIDEYERIGRRKEELEQLIYDKIQQAIELFPSIAVLKEYEDCVKASYSLSKPYKGYAEITINNSLALNRYNICTQSGELIRQVYAGSFDTALEAIGFSVVKSIINEVKNNEEEVNGK